MSKSVYNLPIYLFSTTFTDKYCVFRCIPMGTNCVPIVADLFLISYEKDFMVSLSDETQADIIEAFTSISRYLGLMSITFILNK